jgi:hypothetical protein
MLYFEVNEQDKKERDDVVIFTNCEVMNLEGAFRGMRNPMQSEAMADSYVDDCGVFNAGGADLELAKKLCCSGSDHRKFMRQVFVCVDIEAPTYWWKEFDTYKIGTVANSTSTMHTIHKKEFTLNDFSLNGMSEFGKEQIECMVVLLEECRKMYLETKDIMMWGDMISLLPQSYLQRRTVTLSYEVLYNVYHSRRWHKLEEWGNMCVWIETLPYAKDLICDVYENQERA